MVKPAAPSEIFGSRAWYEMVADQFSKRYNGFSGEFWRTFEEDLAVELVSMADKRVLDLGCGPGRLADRVGRVASRTVGIDHSLNMIQIAMTNTTKGNAVFAVGDAIALPFRSRSFDAVAALGLFEYLDDLSPFLVEIRRLLHSRGRLLFTCYGPPRQIPSIVRATARLMRYNRKNDPLSYRTRELEGLQDSYFRRVRRTTTDLEAALTKAGFRVVKRRGMLYSAPTWLFGQSTRVPIPGLARWTRRAAVAADRLLGKLEWTQRRAPIWIYVAEPTSETV